MSPSDDCGGDGDRHFYTSTRRKAMPFDKLSYNAIFDILRQKDIKI